VAGLDAESWANPADLVTVNRNRFRHSFRGALPSSILAAIDVALVGAPGL
jgi:hypothetical protein